MEINEDLPCKFIYGGQNLGIGVVAYRNIL
jgi:hypothetical protein